MVYTETLLAIQYSWVLFKHNLRQNKVLDQNTDSGAGHLVQLKIRGFLLRFTTANQQCYFLLVWDSHSSNITRGSADPQGSGRVTRRDSTWCHWVRLKGEQEKPLNSFHSLTGMTKMWRFIWNPQYFCEINNCANVYLWLGFFFCFFFFRQ